MRVLHRLSLMAVVVMALNLFGVAFALAQVTTDEVIAGIDQGLYVQPGGESVDAGSLAVVRSAASEEDIDLHVVVLADSVDAESFAQAINERVAGTVLVFTPDTYGAASSELSQGRMNKSLEVAADDLSGDDIVAGAAAFVSAATPRSRPWALIFAAGLLLLVVVAVVGRRVERQATAGRRAAALATRWDGLQMRADAMSDPVLELSTRVELDGRPEMAERYRVAASSYGELAHELGRAPDAARVDVLDAGLTELERDLGLLRSELTTAAP